MAWAQKSSSGGAEMKNKSILFIVRPTFITNHLYMFALQRFRRLAMDGAQALLLRGWIKAELLKLHDWLTTYQSIACKATNNVTGTQFKWIIFKFCNLSVSQSAVAGMCDQPFFKPEASACENNHRNQFRGWGWLFTFNTQTHPEERMKGRCLEPNFFLTLPNLTHLTDLKEFGTKKYKQKSMPVSDT